MNNSEWLDIEQNTDEWLSIRMGRIGGSAIGKIMANYGKSFGKPAHEAALKIALEKITGVRAENNYQNSHMERGHEQEPIAREQYEYITFAEVTNGGYYRSGDIDGCSPDGNISTDGLIEIKSVIASVHYDTIKRGSFDPKYKWQLLYNMRVSGREWIDYVEYCSEFPPGKQLFIQRLTLADYAMENDMISVRLAEFSDLLGEKMEHVNNIEYAGY